MALKLWFSGEELPSAPAANDETGWWVQRLAGVVLASTALGAAALAAGLPQDEIVTAPAAIIEDAPWNVYTPDLPRPVLSTFLAQDEVFPQATLPVDEVYTWASSKAQDFRATLALWPGDELPPPVALAFEEDGNDLSVGRPPQPTYLVWATDELYTPPPPPCLDELYWQQPWLAQPSPVIRLWYGDQETVQAASPLPVDELYWQAPPVQPRTADLRVWAIPDEWPTPPAPLAVDEAYWQVPPVQPRVVDLRIWQVGDEVTQPPTPLQVDDGAGFDFRWPLWATKVVPFRFSDSEEFRSILLTLKAVRDLFMANRVQVMPKTPSEAREELLDFGPYLVPGQQVNGGTALCIVYSGTDPNPSAIVGTCTVNGTQIAVPLLAAGLSGVIYAVTVYASTSNPAEQIPLCFFLAVVPEAL